MPKIPFTLKAASGCLLAFSFLSDCYYSWKEGCRYERVAVGFYWWWLGEYLQICDYHNIKANQFTLPLADLIGKCHWLFADRYFGWSMDTQHLCPFSKYAVLDHRILWWSDHIFRFCSGKPHIVSHFWWCFITYLCQPDLFCLPWYGCAGYFFIKADFLKISPVYCFIPIIYGV